MQHHWTSDLKDEALSTPFYLLEHSALRANLAKIARIKESAGCKVLLALKAFASPGFFPEMSAVLDGTSSSSPLEAQLAKGTFPGSIHSYCPAFSDQSLEELLKLSSHINLNSVGQLEAYADRILASGVSLGLRVNPEHSETDVEIYDPCRKGSRLGVTAEQLAKVDPKLLAKVEGLHMHTLCENSSEALERTLKVLEAKFAPLLQSVSWINLGGGHLIGEQDYDADHLATLLRGLRERYAAEVYIEPGSGVVIDTGFFATEVLDISENSGAIAIVDSSAAAHLPDVLEMPYRPEIIGAGVPEKYPHRYRIGGLTCLSGDEIGEYSFPEPLKIGQRLWLTDMAHYTIIKNTSFNGLPLPAIHYYDREDGSLRTGATFGYDDYASRIG